VTGELLPVQSGATDPAVGALVPELEGVDLSGNPVTIGHDGRAKIIMVVAHWCPYCQDEIPVVREWLEAGSLGDEVDFYTIATFTDPSRDNFPPDEWLEREQLGTPIILDDADSTAARAFGANAVPFWLIVNDDATLVTRGSGSLPAEALDSLVDFLVNGPSEAP
jgi:thiol-disulfide isomerase/thioredoxin